MHRIARAVIEQEAHFQLVEFEHVEAAPGTALLRVVGRPPAQMPSGPLTLVIDDGVTEHRHEQLPALPGPPGLVRAAFSAPLEHVNQSATYSLVLPGDETVRLPVPAHRRAPDPAQAPDAAATSPVSGPATEESPGEP